MSKINPPIDYDEFYVRIPYQLDTDPLSELSTELEDLSVAPDYDQSQGLSHEQVSQIARDALHDAQEREQALPSEANLFSVNEQPQEPR
jgi:hypothetical protein